jgi:hypothetical protein
VASPVCDRSHESDPVDHQRLFFFAFDADGAAVRGHDRGTALPAEDKVRRHGVPVGAFTTDDPGAELVTKFGPVIDYGDGVPASGQGEGGLVACGAAADDQDVDQ